MTWYQFLAFNVVGMVGVLLAVLLGGWLVFKAKTITMPTPFIQMPQRSPRVPQTYMDESLRETSDILSEDLSPAAARLRAQSEDTKESILAFVKGSK